MKYRYKHNYRQWNAMVLELDANPTMFVDDYYPEKKIKGIQPQGVKEQL